LILTLMNYAYQWPRIRKLIDNYEKRICVVSITYDNNLSPWQLSFIVKCFFRMIVLKNLI
ncbi:hypothetical protein OLS48_05365, partial [Campylobacter jejuni]|nr:hypothetical protein [Campylobacter jejuni]